MSSFFACFGSSSQPRESMGRIATSDAASTQQSDHGLSPFQGNVKASDASDIASSRNPCIVLTLKAASPSSSASEDMIQELPLNNQGWLTCHLSSLNASAREALRIALQGPVRVTAEDIHVVKKALNGMIKSSPHILKGLSDAALSVASPSISDAREARAELTLPDCKGWPGASLPQMLRITGSIVRDQNNFLSFIPVLSLEVLPSTSRPSVEALQYKDVSIRSAVRLSCESPHGGLERSEKMSLLRAGAMISAIPCIATLMELHPTSDDFCSSPGQLFSGRILMQNELSLAYWGKLDQMDHDGSWLIVKTLFASSMDVVPDMIRQLSEQRQRKADRPDDLVISLWKTVVKVVQRMERINESVDISISLNSISLKLHKHVHEDASPSYHQDISMPYASHSRALVEILEEEHEDEDDSLRLTLLSPVEPRMSAPRIPQNVHTFSSSKTSNLEEASIGKREPESQSEALIFRAKTQLDTNDDDNPSSSFTKLAEAYHSLGDKTDTKERKEEKLKRVSRAITFSTSSALPNVETRGMAIQPSGKLLSILQAIQGSNAGVAANSNTTMEAEQIGVDPVPASLVEYSETGLLDADGRKKQVNKDKTFDITQIPIVMAVEEGQEEVDRRKLKVSKQISLSNLSNLSRHQEEDTTASSSLNIVSPSARISKVMATKSKSFNHKDLSTAKSPLSLPVQDVQEISAIRRIGSGLSHKPSNASKIASTLDNKTSTHLSDLDIEEYQPIILGQNKREEEEEEEEDTELKEIRWHEVQAVPVQDPVTGKDAVLLLQTDITTRAIMEQRMAALTESQLSMLEEMFPRHVLEFIMGAAPPEATLGDLAYQHDDVTILFMDIVGFTSMSKEVPPQMVMEFLNSLFSKFDLLLDEYNVYKVETAGDCYIVAGALMVADEEGFMVLDGEGDARDGARNVILFAQAMLSHARTICMPHNGQPTCVRVGVHTGSVVSGLIGSKLPKFSLFGDTMNTSSRMESTSRPGCIQVSESTYAMLEEDQRSLFEATGGVEVKGKGLMPTYITCPYVTESAELVESTPPPAIERSISQKWSSEPSSNDPRHPAEVNILSPSAYGPPSPFARSSLRNSNPFEANARGDGEAAGALTECHSPQLSIKPSGSVALGKRRVKRNESFRRSPSSVAPPTETAKALAIFPSGPAGRSSSKGSESVLDAYATMDHIEIRKTSGNVDVEPLAPSPRSLSKFRSMPKARLGETLVEIDEERLPLTNPLLGKNLRLHQGPPVPPASQCSDPSASLIPGPDHHDVTSSGPRPSALVSALGGAAMDDRLSRNSKPKLWSNVAHRLNTLVGKMGPAKTKERRTSVVMLEDGRSGSEVVGAALEARFQGEEGKLESKGQMPQREAFSKSASKRHTGIMSLGQQMREVAMADLLKRSSTTYHDE